jgi:DNA-binding MarR family transcriptional regulator
MPRKPKPDYAAQPAVAATLKLISRKRGATAAEVANARGLQPHTVRAVISRLGSKAGIKVERVEDEKRGTVYRAGGAR